MGRQIVTARDIAISRTFENLGLAQHAWANDTFGNGSHRSPLPALHHLKEEVEELLAAPDDRMEYADALLLLLDASQSAGITPEQLLDAAYEKQEINRQRKWGTPDENGVCKHVD